MKTTPIVIIALAAGAVLGGGTIRLAERSRATEEAPALQAATAVTERVQVVKTITNIVTRIVTNQNVVVSSTEANELQGEVTRLNALLAAQEAKLAEIAAAEEAARQQREARRLSWTERETKMREEEPERFAEMQKRREEFQTRMTQAVTDRTTFLKGLDTAKMSESQKQTHEELLNRIESASVVMAQLQQGERPDREQMESLRENYQAIGELYEAERDYVLQQVGTGLGLKDEEAVDFGVYIKEIFELTSPRGGMPGGRGGPGGGMGGNRRGGDRGGDRQNPAQP